MAASWDALAKEHGPQIAAYNAATEPEEPEAGAEREYTVRVDFVASVVVTIDATSAEAALAEGFEEALNPHDRTFEWEVIDTRLVDEP